MRKLLRKAWYIEWDKTRTNIETKKLDKDRERDTDKKVKGEGKKERERGE